MSDKLREAKDLVREADTLLQGRITGNLQLGKTDYKRLVAILSRDLPAALSAPQADAGEVVAWGRVVDGKAVTVSREWTPANDEPLYAKAPSAPSADMRRALEYIADQRWNEDADLDTICTTADKALSSADCLASEETCRHNVPLHQDCFKCDEARADDGKKSEGGE